jgi:uncharacterized membrane protein YfcA
MEIWKYFLLYGAGTASGFINSMAGGGSLITLPILIFLGLPASVANGTNRLAVIVSCAAGTANFHRKKMIDYNTGKWFILPAVIGAIIGAQVSVEIPDEIFKRILAGVMIFVLAMMIIRPQRFFKTRETR